MRALHPLVSSPLPPKPWNHRADVTSPQTAANPFRFSSLDFHHIYIYIYNHHQNDRHYCCCYIFKKCKMNFPVPRSQGRAVEDGETMAVRRAGRSAGREREKRSFLLKLSRVWVLWTRHARAGTRPLRASYSPTWWRWTGTKEEHRAAKTTQSVSKQRVHKHHTAFRLCLFFILTSEDLILFARLALLWKVTSWYLGMEGLFFLSLRCCLQLLFSLSTSRFFYVWKKNKEQSISQDCVPHFPSFGKFSFVFVFCILY